jgi:circadian clock protein KaiC
MKTERTRFGIEGLDAVLDGGLPTGLMYLVVGYPGTGKTTLGFQFLLEGNRAGEPTLYITLSETEEEVATVARSHGWSLEGVSFFGLDAAEQALGLGDQQTMFDPSDIEFRETSRAVLAEIERVSPARVVFDSLSELALLARDPLGFRRELLLLKRDIMRRGATTLVMSDRTSEETDRHLHSLAHGVIELDEISPEYAPERRRLRVRKLRGSRYRGGFHDFEIRRGGVELFPRLVAAEDGEAFDAAPLASGVPELDRMLGGGLPRGASTLAMGPAGSGKSSIVSLFTHASAEAGEPAAVFLFDEERRTFLDRAEALGHPLRPHTERGLVEVQQVAPAELSPGEFIHRVRHAVETRGARFVAVDSLNGYTYAMSGERFPNMQMHETLSYLAKSGVATMLVLTHSGLLGPMRSPAGLTYIADALLLTRFFEAGGQLRRAVSMLKNRVGYHDTYIRELRFSPSLSVSEPLRDVEGVLSGVPQPRRQSTWPVTEGDVDA